MNRIAKEHDKETWLSEIAWSAKGGPEVGVRLQAAYLHRIYLLAAWAGTDKVFWFWDRNLGGQGRFSGTGLIDMEAKPKVALPAGAAMAAASKFIARATYAGSVDIGGDRWCLLFRRPEGGWMAAAWAVGAEFPLPNELEPVSEAFDMYGNPLKDRRLSDEPAYFYMDGVPADWEGQREVRWLGPRVVNMYQDGNTLLEVEAGPDVSLAFENLPEGARVGNWTRDGSMWKATLQAAPSLSTGVHPVRAVASADGWRKTFPVRLEVRPSLDVNPNPYTAGTSSEITVTLLTENATTARFSADAPGVKITPETVKLETETPNVLTLRVPEKLKGPLHLNVSLDNGGAQSVWVRPRNLHVPRADNIRIDGNLAEWPGDRGVLGIESLRLRGLDTDFAPEMRLAWSPEGLYVASRIPVGEGATPPAKPMDFWEWTSLEMNMNAADVGTAPGEVRSHLLFFVPTKDSEDGPWRVFAGQWNKRMPDGSQKSVFDDDRTETAMTYEDGVMTIEVFIPKDVLEAAPQA
ncbi:MAG: hypothetical protein PF795_05240 [Kiritimatiellae bacterium]|jgi:hypothetical protein|nr:hypothetical protein [Kiritimatiellia bacterium]